MPLERVQLDVTADVSAEDVNRIQTNVERAVKALEAPPKRITVTFAATAVDTRAYHHLGRPLVAWKVVRSSNAIVVYDGAPSADPTVYHNVRAAALGGVGTVVLEVD